MAKTDFSKYEDMPVRITIDKKKENPWFDKYITKMGLDMDGSYLVKINEENSLKVEADIKINESYNADFTRKIYEYYCYKIGASNLKVGVSAKEPITDIIRMIDLENSTNIWRYKKNRIFLKNMVDYITDPETHFWTRLKNGEVRLVDDLRKASGAETDGPKSLASKICKYLCEMFFDKDNYYINDNVVRHVLPYYLDYYGIETEGDSRTYFDKLSYEKLHHYLEKIKEATCPTLTKSNVDHIMWYCYRYEKL